MKSFGVKCLFSHPLLEELGNTVYEERIIFVRADSFDFAIKLAEKEAEEYSKKVKALYLGFANAYESSSLTLESGIEVYSLMRKSSLGEDDYIDRFYDTGDECI